MVGEGLVDLVYLVEEELQDASRLAWLTGRVHAEGCPRCRKTSLLVLGGSSITNRFGSAVEIARKPVDLAVCQEQAVWELDR